MDRLAAAQQYLMQEKSCTALVAQRLLEKVFRYEDIFNDFYHWLMTRNYYHEDAVVIEGYNAQALVDLAPMLDGIGAFNFLVDLREHPQKSLETIRKGFVR